MRLRCAPSAMRIPISCVRCLTQYETAPQIPIAARASPIRAKAARSRDAHWGLGVALCDKGDLDGAIVEFRETCAHTRSVGMATRRSEAAAILTA
jgi:hypothetical protein